MTTETDTSANPKMFISYSWSSPDHENWVLRLATDLRESGVDVILDKWNLKEGHDANAFMEKMATDPNIRKVLLVCDKNYADKTNGRTGGVGTEAQIISAEIYQRQDQNKFVAVLKERDENGNPYLPVYYRSRIYVDLSDESIFAEGFEQLVRWAYDQPLHKKPELGQKPKYLTDETQTVSLATASRHKRAIEALRNNRPNAIPATVEYFQQVTHEFEKLRIDSKATPFDEEVIQSIEQFVPYRNEAIEVFSAIATHADGPESRTAVHRFFESLIPYMERPSSVTYSQDTDWDNFKFIVHELFLYAFAIYLGHERFEAAEFLLANRYYVLSPDSEVMRPFVIFRPYVRSLSFRNDRLKLGRLSVRADLLKDRCKGSAIQFRHLQQADFVLFIRSRSAPADLSWHDHYWFPETLVYRHNGAFELFARSRSKNYFDRAKALLGVKDKTELEMMLKEFSENPQQFPRWQHDSFNAAYLLGFDKLATQP